MAERDETADHDVKQSIRMTADRLLVHPSKEAGERKSRSGILIPATANVDRRLVWGDVVALGPTVRNVEPNDRGLFSPESGYEVEIRGDEYLILGSATSTPWPRSAAKARRASTCEDRDPGRHRSGGERPGRPARRLWAEGLRRIPRPGQGRGGRRGAG